MEPSPEFLAIVYALDERGQSGRLEALSKLLGDPAFDWVLLQELVLRHRVLGLFCVALKEAGLWERIPDSVRSLLDKNFRHTQLRQLSAVGSLIEVSKSLAVVGIEFLCLKGPVLGQILFKDPVLRHFGDLDLLVRQADISRTVAELRLLGFELLDLKDIESKASNDPLWKDLYHVHLRRGELSLELHWRLSRNDRLYGFSTDRLFAEKQKVVLGGECLYTLANVHLVDYLAIHGASHSWNRLKWLCDGSRLRAFIEYSVGSADRSDAIRLMESLCDSLWCKEGCRAIYIPDDRNSLLCLRQLLSPEEYPGSIGNMARRTRVLFCLYPTLKSKVAYLGTLLVWPRVYELVRLPKYLSFFYYIIGPFLWLKAQLVSEESVRIEKNR